MRVTAENRAEHSTGALPQNAVAVIEANAVADVLLRTRNERLADAHKACADAEVDEAQQVVQDERLPKGPGADDVDDVDEVEPCAGGTRHANACTHGDRTHTTAP